MRGRKVGGLTFLAPTRKTQLDGRQRSVGAHEVAREARVGFHPASERCYLRCCRRQRVPANEAAHLDAPLRRRELQGVRDAGGVLDPFSLLIGLGELVDQR